MRDSHRVLLAGFLVLLCCSRESPAQAPIRVTGRVVDAQRAAIPGATVLMLWLPDTTKRWGAVANARGEFELVLPQPGQYQLRVSSVGYRTLHRRVLLRQDQDLGELQLETDAIRAGEVTVEAVQERATVKEDTVEYAASAYRVNPDATAEDLVRKLPGVTIQGGQIQAQGETVQRVLVDGREFFGQDPMAVLRTLPAEVVQSVQIFDRESEQARLTGIRDPGSTEKTLNIITNPAMRTGRFGRLYGGYGTTTRYQAGATLNFFRDTLRFSLVGLSNNVNQQNFALDDILGIVNFAGQQPSGGPPPTVLRMMFQGGRFPGPPPGMQRGGPRGPFAQIGTFFVPEQGGINTAHALGGMYSNRWGRWLEVTGSYIFNTLLNTSDTRLQRQYFGGDTLGSFYGEQSHSEGTLGTHRLNLRVEFSPDTTTTLLFVPRLAFQPTESTPVTWSFAASSSGDTLSRSAMSTTTTTRALQSSSQLLFVRRFAPGRSLSVELTGEYNPRTQRSQQKVELSGLVPQRWDSTLSLRLERSQPTGSLEVNVTYSEPFDSLHILQVRYNPAWEWSTAEQDAWGSQGTTELPLPSLTSRLLRRAGEQRAGVAYLYQGRAFQWNARLDYSWYVLRAEEQRATPWAVERRFSFWLPFLMAEWRPTRTENLRAVYRSFVTLPTASQLQNVVDNSNPMALSSGNPELQPSFTHLLFARYHRANLLGGSFFFAMLRLMYTVDPITTATLIAERDTLIRGFPLARGGQYTTPVNLDASWSGRTFWVVGMPVPWLRSTLNANMSFDYMRSPSLVNGKRVSTEWYAPAVGLSLSSNWSQQVDFMLSYTLSANRVRTTAATGQSDYLQHQFSADFTLMPGSWVLLSQLRWSKYTGLGGELDKPITLWNLGVGYRFLQNNAAELRLVVTDVLGQNKGIARVVTGQYVEDSTTQLLGRYAMLMLSYRLRNFAL
ncbi:hypothetical protein HRbin21_00840 [bacterium HR21]|nr:hypothetical protein HRbin21_00840 [bacterium HR21]